MFLKVSPISHETTCVGSLFNKDADFQAIICDRENSTILHFAQLKAQTQISKKRCFKKYCSLLKKLSFPSIWSHLLKKSLIENFIFRAVVHVIKNTYFQLNKAYSDRCIWKN